MDDFKDLVIPYVREGVVRSAELAETVGLSTSCQRAVNFHFDSTGAVTSRAGITQYTPVSSPAIQSFGTWAENAGNLKRLLIQRGDEMYSFDGTSETLVRTMSSSNLARFCQFTNYTYMVNGSTAAGGDPVQTFHGTTFGTTNVGGAPAGDMIAYFGGRICIGNIAEDRIYYSKIVEPDGTIIFDTANDYIYKTSPGNGEKMTALIQVPRALLILKPNSIYRVYSITEEGPSLDDYSAYNVGTYSQESIVTAKDATYFHHSSGIYKVSSASQDLQPVEISRRISDIINAIPRSQYGLVKGWKDDNHIYWSIGTVNLADGVIENAVIRYTISSEVWTVYGHSGAITAAINYDDGVNLNSIVAYSGKVGRYGVGYDDCGDRILAEIVTRRFPITENYARMKDVSRIAAVGINCAGLTASFQIDSDLPNRWTEIGKINTNIVSDLSTKDMRHFNVIAFRLHGDVTGSPVTFYTFELSYASQEGYRNR